jgi:hypothetical protein
VKLYPKTGTREELSLREANIIGSIKIDGREMSFPGKHTCTRAILELRERDYRKPTAHVVKCHIFGVAVMHDLLKVSGFQG